MNRQHLTQIVLVIAGLCNLPQTYLLFMDLWHSNWILEGKPEVAPMFLSFFVPAAVFLLLAARKPAEYRSAIALVAWWNICHGTVMGIQSVEAWGHGIHRNFADAIVVSAIGLLLLAVLPGKMTTALPQKLSS